MTEQHISKPLAAVLKSLKLDVPEQGSEQVSEQRPRKPKGKLTAILEQGKRKAKKSKLLAPPVNWRTIEDDREKYQAYLCSREWAEKRNIVIARACKACERCNISPISHVHHLTYIRKYNEHPDDLQGLCKDCHEFTHGLSEVDPLEARRGQFPLTKSLFENQGLWGDLMTCPVCECENVHFDGKPYFVEGLDDYKAEWGGRGDLVKVPMWCEWNHRWDLCFGFHKGTMSAFTWNARDIEPEDEDNASDV